MQLKNSFMPFTNNPCFSRQSACIDENLEYCHLVHQLCTTKLQTKLNTKYEMRLTMKK